MSKSALGRGLGELMSGQKAPSNLPTSPITSTSNSSDQPATDSATAQPQLEATPGVETLLRGKTEVEKAVETNNPFAETPRTEIKPPVNWSLIKWVLVIADILLLVPTSLFVLTKTGRLSFVEGAVCVITFAFAAVLGCLAYFIHVHREE